MEYPYPMPYQAHGLPASAADLWLEIRSVHDDRGSLSFVEAGQDLPFALRRAYYLYDVKASRGGHAHIQQEQLFIALNGRFTLALDDGTRRHAVTLDTPRRGILAGRMVWRDITDFSPGAVCLVLASTPYTADDYIRDYARFLQQANAS